MSRRTLVYDVRRNSALRPPPEFLDWAVAHGVRLEDTYRIKVVGDRLIVSEYVRPRHYRIGWSVTPTLWIVSRRWRRRITCPPPMPPLETP